MPTFPPPPLKQLRRVVITGLGLVTPLGVTVPHVWSRLLAGESGINPSFDSLTALVPRGATSPTQWDPTRHVPRSESRSMSPDYISFALGAADEALRDAGLLVVSPLDTPPTTNALVDPATGRMGDSPYSPFRMGVSIGNGIGGLEEVSAGAVSVAGGGTGTSTPRLSPFFVPRILVNMAAGGVALRYGLRGPALAPATACASGAQAIGEAARAIACGAADAMVAGGSEAVVGRLALAGFGRARALGSPQAWGTTHPGCTGPFSAHRDGFVLGEGAGVCILETLEGALARGAPVIYGEVRGYGAGCDAHHITTPRGDGSGSAACMGAALGEGGLHPRDVGYINAHATGTPGGDGVEALGIASVWGGENGPAGGSGSGSGGVLVSSTKGAVGHLLGAAGAVEAIFSLLALRHGVVPATVGLKVLDPALAPFSRGGGGKGVINFVGEGGDAKGVAVPGGLKAVMSNSFGFGGVNVSLLFSKVD